MRPTDQGLRAAVALANSDDETAACRDLRRIFDAVATGNHPAAVARINALIAGVVPRLVEHDDQLHLAYVHDAAEAAGAAEAAIALALLVADTGLDRLRICASPNCHHALIDLTRNASRRFCHPRCANRHHVATYRERRSR